MHIAGLLSVVGVPFVLGVLVGTRRSRTVIHVYHGDGRWTVRHRSNG